MLESYYNETNGPCATQTGPTNAGYVPYTPQTMYIERGFGYYGSQSANDATTLVGMTTAGSSPTATSVANALAQFAPFLAPETSNSGSQEIKATAVQSAVPGLLSGASTSFRNVNPSSSNGCAASRYVILVTDGLPTLDLNGGSWPPPGTTSATEWNMTVAFNADGSLKTPAYVTVFFNGIIVQNHFELKGETLYIGKPFYKKFDSAPIKLQAHGDKSEPISYRNIWVRELK